MWSEKNLWMKMLSTHFYIKYGEEGPEMDNIRRGWHKPSDGFLALIVPVDTAVWQVLSPQVKVRENKSKKWFVTTVFITKNGLSGIISSMEDSLFGLSTTPWNLSQNYLYHWCPTDKDTALPDRWGHIMIPLWECYRLIFSQSASHWITPEVWLI